MAQIPQVGVLLGNFISNCSPDKLQNAIVHAKQQKIPQYYFMNYYRKLTAVRI